MSTSHLPDGPIETEPIEHYRHLDFPEIQALLDEALEGIDLGAYDRRLVEWAKRAWDQPTMVTIASWILRARQADPR